MKNYYILAVLLGILLAGCIVNTPWGQLEFYPEEGTDYIPMNLTIANATPITFPTAPPSSSPTSAPFTAPTSTPVASASGPRVVWFDSSAYWGFMLEVDGLVTAADYDRIGVVASSGESLDASDEDALFLSSGPTGTPRNLVVRLPYMMTEELWDWRSTVTDGSIERKNMALILLDDERNQVKRFGFTRAWPYGYEVTVEDGMVYETIYIAVETAQDLS